MIHHRFPHTRLRQCDGSLARQRISFFCAGEDFLGVAPNFFFDGFKRLRLRTAVVFDGCADDAAGVGDEVGQHERAPIVENFFRFRRKGNIGTLRYKFGLQSGHIVLANDVGPRSGYPDLAFDIDDGIGVEPLCVGIIPDVFTGILERD